MKAEEFRIKEGILILSIDDSDVFAEQFSNHQNAELRKENERLREVLRASTARHVHIRKMNDGCFVSGCDGKGAIQVAEDEWEPCQACDELRREQEALNQEQ